AVTVLGRGRRPFLCVPAPDSNFVVPRKRSRESAFWPSRPRVMRFVNLLQALLDHVRVNLRRGNTRVAQHELDRTEVRTAFQKVRGKTVAQLMRRKLSAQTQANSIIVQNPPNGYAAEPLAEPGQKKNLVVRRRARWPREFRTGVSQVLLDSLDGLAPDGHQSLLVSL